MINIKEYIFLIIGVVMMFLLLNGCNISIDETVSNINIPTVESNTSSSSDISITKESNDFLAGESSNSKELATRIPKLDLLSNDSYYGVITKKYFDKMYDRIVFNNASEVKEIEKNDPNLIRLLNFIGYALDNNEVSISQGQVDKDFYDWKLESVKYIELFVSKNDILSEPYYSRYIINDYGFMAIRDQSKGYPDNLYEDECIPYAIWLEPYREVLLMGYDLSSEYNGNNLLDYCGY